MIIKHSSPVQLRTALSSIVVSVALAGCGSSSSSNSEAEQTADEITQDIDDVLVGNDEDIEDEEITITEPDQSTEDEEIAALQFTDDPETGGFFGNEGPPANLVTIPDDTEGFTVSVVSREDQSGLRLTSRFGTFRTERHLQEFMSDFNRPLDSCHQTDVRIGTGFGDLLVPRGNFIGLSAGEVLPLSTAAGSVGELVEGASYRTNAFDDASVSEDDVLSISIPGNDIPAYETTAFPQIAMDGFNPTSFSSDALGVNEIRRNFDPSIIQTLRWRASIDPGTYIHIEFEAELLTGSDEDTLGRSDPTPFRCSLEDDGEFTFPQELIDLYSINVSVSEADLNEAARVKVTTVNQEDGVLILINYTDI